MKRIKTIGLSIFLLFLIFANLNAQPIPVELMMGNKYGTVDVVFSKKFSPDSRFSFFHLSSVVFDYDEKYKNSFILQEMVLFETIKNLNISAGFSYTKGGLNPSAGIQYQFINRNWMLLSAPKFSFGDETSFDMMNIIQYKTPINEQLKFCARAKFLNVLDKNGNIKSYQWIRAGIETKGIQFGLALNLDEFGPNPSVETNYGLYIRKDIF